MKTHSIVSSILLSVLLQVNYTQCQDLKLCYIDAKAGDTIKAIRWTRLIKTPDDLVNFCVSQKNSQVYLELKYNFGDKESFSVSDTNSLWLKLQNGNTIKLKSRDNVVSKKGISTILEDLSGITLQGVYVYYPVTHEQSISLQSSVVTKIRIFSSRGFDTIVLDGGAAALSDGFRVISNKPKKFKIMNKPTEEEKNPEPW